MNKKIFVVAGILVSVIIIMMIFTNPSKADYDDWISKEHGVSCSGEGQNEKCLKNNQQIANNSSSHFRDAGIISSLERTLEFEDGDQKSIRLFGVFGTIYPMKDGAFWGMVN